MASIYRLHVTFNPTVTVEELELARLATEPVYRTLDSAHAAGFRLWNGPKGIRAAYKNVAVIEEPDTAK